jgi:uncharacterized membrane protein YqhA
VQLVGDIMPSASPTRTDTDCPTCGRHDGQPRRAGDADHGGRGASRPGVRRSDGAQPDQARHNREHPTVVAPLADLIGRTRFVVLLAVLSVLLLSIVMFVVGSAQALAGAWHATASLLQGNPAATELSVEILEIVTVMMKAVVFYLIGVGLYSLFIAPLNVTAALGISTLNDLELKIVSVIIVILGVTYLEHFIRWQEPFEILIYGFSLAVVVAALVFFQNHTHGAARADAEQDAGTRASAQHELFHEDHEQREVTADESAAEVAPARRPSEAT